MKIIEKVEIKYFRSFADKKVEIDNLRDLNIFSGSNDSGKSNILRGINLFFNNETSPGTVFNVNNDLSKLQQNRSNERVNKKREGGKTEARQKDLFVDVKIHFLLPRDFGGMLPKKFFVSRRWTKTRSAPPYQESNVETRYKKEKGELTTNQRNALLGQLTQFLNKIEFRYVPAIKDRGFFRHLYKELQGKLLEKEISEIKSESRKLQDVIKKETTDLFDEFKRSTGIDASFLLLEEDLINFEKSVEVETMGNIFLPHRGDGIQARFIPDVLNELSKSSKKKFILWGFEEPENSYELKNIKKLRGNFIDTYSVNKQIFITTHSREFLSIRNENSKSEKVSIYRVYKKADESSQVVFYDDKKGFDKEKIQLSFWEGTQKTSENKTVLEELFNDLGIIDESRKIVELEELLKRSGNSNLELQEVIDNLKKPIVFVEDEKFNLYKIAWLKLNEHIIDSSNFDNIFNKEAPFIIKPAAGKKELYKKLDMVKMKEFDKKKVIGVFDFDEAFNDFNGLKNKERWGDIDGQSNNSLFRKRKDFDNIFAVVIPIPNHRKKYVSDDRKKCHLIIEHLFTDKILKTSGHLDGSLDIGGGGKIVKIKRKKYLWISALKFDKKDFKDFIPLFDRISGLLSFENLDSKEEI